MSDDRPPYHRWSRRQRAAFELIVQLILCFVIGVGVFECVGPPTDPPRIQGK